MEYESPKVEKVVPIRALMGGINISLTVPGVGGAEVNIPPESGP